MIYCPRDNAPLTTVNRQGIEIDICPHCQGIWLDRGELEKLIEAEAGHAIAETASGYDASSPVNPHKVRNDRTRRLIEELFDKLD